MSTFKIVYLFIVGKSIYVAPVDQSTKVCSAYACILYNQVLRIIKIAVKRDVKNLR